MLMALSSRRLGFGPRASFALAMTFGLMLFGCTERGGPPPTPAPQKPARIVATPAHATPPPKMVESSIAASEDVSPPPPATPAEAYDLSADQQRRARIAKDELGPKTVTTVVSDVFVVIGPPGWQGGQFEQSVGLMRSSMAGYMNGRFGKKPAQAISVYLFPNAKTYESFCARKYSAPCIAHFGFYQPGDRDMVMNIGLGLGTLTHEIVHPLVEADFPEAPTWINEGIASVFEQPVLPKPGEIHGGKNWRHPRLKRALSSVERDRARLDHLFGMSDETFRGDAEDLHYAMARYVCQWLDERGKLWPFYQRWRDNVRSDPTGQTSFTEVVGMTPAEAHVVWAKWVLAL
jgi:hypothetical protein